MTAPHEVDQDGQSSTEGPKQDFAHAQALYREVNDHIRSVSSGPDLELVCECTDGACVEAIPISASRYDEIRRFPTRFLVKPGHELPVSERVVDTSHDFAVVEKTGVPTLIADERDLRKATDRALAPSRRAVNR